MSQPVTHLPEPFAARVEVQRSERQTATFDALGNLQPDKMLQHIQAWKAGRIYDLARVIDAIEERDDVLITVIPKAVGDVARRPWEILTVETTDPLQKDLAKRQRDVLMRTFNDLHAGEALDLDSEGGTRLLIDQLLTALSHRYSIHALQWVYLPPRSGEMHGSYTVRAMHVPAWWCEASTGKLRFIATPHGYDGIDMEPDHWLTAVKPRSIGLAEASAWMGKRMPLRDWQVYCNRYGLPGIEGITDAARGTPEYEAVREAVAMAGSEAQWIRSRSAEIRTVDFTSQGEQPHPDLVERMDRMLTRMWRGADLSTMSAGNGAGDGASLQGDESQTLADDRAAWVSEVLNRRIASRVLEMVFGPGVPRLAYFAISTPKGPKGYVDLAIDRELLSWGHPMSQEQAAERYGRPLPPAGAVLLRPPAPTGPAAINEAPRTTPTSVPAVLLEELRKELKVPASWLEPVQRVLEEIARKAGDQRLSDKELLDAAEAAIKSLPELLGEMDVAALADVFERGMGTAALDAAKTALTPTPKTA